jgi:chromosome segregation ATPase
MENGQLEKKVEWLDQERRSALDAVAKLEQRIAALEANLAEERGKIAPLQKELSRLSVLVEKVDAFEKELKANKKDVQKDLKDQQKANEQSQKELKQSLVKDQNDLARGLEDVRSGLQDLKALEKEQKKMAQEDQRLSDKLVALEKSLDGVLEAEQQRESRLTTIQESNDKATNRIAETRGEVEAMLDKVEKAVARVEIVSQDQRKLKDRVDEINTDHYELRTQQQEFFEKATARDMDQSRQWAEWGKRFDKIEAQSQEVATRLKEMETADIAVRRAQRAFDELVEKINRRINELNEMQRLGEQRFRQEWSTFQADSQKRWSTFTLGYDEQRQEAKRQRDRLAQQIINIEDNLTEVQDTAVHLSEQLERYLQNMLEVFRETLSENERFFGS